MTREEIIAEIADILEIEESDVIESARLEDFEAWDSVAVLGVISLVSDATGRYPHADEIKSFDTIGDIMRYLGV